MPSFLVSAVEKGAELVGWVVFTAGGVSDPEYPQSNLLEWVVGSSPPWHSWSVRVIKAQPCPTPTCCLQCFVLQIHRYCEKMHLGEGSPKETHLGCFLILSWVSGSCCLCRRQEGSVPFGAAVGRAAWGARQRVTLSPSLCHSSNNKNERKDLALAESAGMCWGELRTADAVFTVFTPSKSKHRQW